MRQYDFGSEGSFKKITKKYQKTLLPQKTSEKDVSLSFTFLRCTFSEIFL
jgi:hypothetical protein